MTGKHSLTYQGMVYPWHCDHMGHMNVMWYAGKFDEATWHHFASIGISTEYLRNNDLGMAAVDQHIVYKAELLSGDLVTIRSHWLEVKEKTLRFRHEMYNSQTNTLAAISDMIAVHMNSKTRKAQAFDATIMSNVQSALEAQ